MPCGPCSYAETVPQSVACARPPPLVDFTVGTEGLAALHAADTSEFGHRAGETTLSFESEEPLEGVRDRLHAAGFTDAHIIDEAYGRMLVVTDPDGIEVIVNEEQQDLYGYRRETDAA